MYIPSRLEIKTKIEKTINMKLKILFFLMKVFLVNLSLLTRENLQLVYKSAIIFNQKVRTFSSNQAS